MHTINLSKAALVLASVLIASCGGEDSHTPNAGSPGGGTPTSPVESNYPPAPIGGLAATSFDSFGWFRDERSGTVSRSETAPISMSWDGSTYYTASFEQVGSGRLRYFPFQEGINKSTYALEKPDGTVLPISIRVTQLDQISQTPRTLEWQYPASTNESVSVTLSGTVVVGQFSQVAPSSGKKTYRDAGTGQTHITLDFDSGQVTGQLAIYYVDSWFSLPPYIVPLENIVLDSGKLTFAGEFSIAGVTEKGRVEGQLFEPGANALALRIEGRIPDIYTNGTLPFWYAWVIPVAAD